MLNKFISTYSDFKIRYSLRLERPIKKWTLMLPGSGCEFWKNTGGCNMCGFNNATQQYTHGHLFPSFIFSSFFTLANWHNSENPDELSIFNGGSFWNDKEIPAIFQEKVCRKVSKHVSLQSLLIETRCEYITEEKIIKAQKLLSGKKIVVAIGLECQDDHLRNKVIGKGLSKETFEKKVKLLRSCDADALAYVFLKPVGLNEKQALDETLNTIDYALSVGVSAIEISSAFIQQNTKMADLFAKNLFTPPNLWTVLEIIKKIKKNNWPVNIGGFTDEPPPIAIPANCDYCSKQIYEAIEQFRQTRVLGEIPHCSCKKEWGNKIRGAGSDKSSNRGTPYLSLV